MKQTSLKHRGSGQEMIPMRRFFLALLPSLFLLCFLESPVMARGTAGDDEYLTVAVIGDSRSDGKEGVGGVNDEVLSKIFAMIKKNNPRAVFFSGDLTLGLEEEEVAEGLYQENTPTPPVQNKQQEDHWAKAGFVYDSKAFKASLNHFSALRKQYLGPSIPLYPVIGNHEAVGPDAAKIFKHHFGITHEAPLGDGHLAYTVELGKSIFIVLATDYYSRDQNKLIEHTLSGGQKEWLERTLKDKSPRFSSVFVIGHEPAFSVLGGAKGHPVGLDLFPEARDEFWSILKKYGVKAYICSHEHLYHSAKHDGMWQIISGGAGAPLAPLNSGGFFHYALLKIPMKSGSAPKLIVVGIDGVVRPEIVLE
jgi:3',5'-cyclic AMP phosphodiesterase CpdA